MRAVSVTRGCAVVTVSLVVAACGGGSGQGGGEASEDPIVLRGATAWDENAINSVGFFMLKEKVEEASDGRLIIEYVGGPEAIPPFEQAEAVRSGVVDIADLSTAYYAPQLPAAQILNYSELTPTEERENGALDYLNELHHETLNAHILGRSMAGSYSVYTADPVTSMSDLQQLTFRATPTYVPLIEALGTTYIQTPGAEIYSAVERGIVGGYVWPDHGVSDMGLHEVTACQVKPFFWTIDDVNLMNLDTWNSLPDDLKEILEEASIEVANEVGERVEEYRAQEAELFAEGGVETCELTDGDALAELAQESAWDWVNTSLPEHAEKFQELFRK